MPYPCFPFRGSLLIGFCLLYLLLMTGCSGSSFRVQDLAKTDIDMVADLHYQQVELLLKELTVKLYKRNPRELQKVPGKTIDLRVTQIFTHPGKPQFAELGGGGIDAMQLSVDPVFRGDRVFALMVGMTGMIRESYGLKTEFFMLSKLDHQKLYHSARNIEIAMWRIRTHLDEQGKALILTNSRRGEGYNLSYERLFGKLIAHQDMLALIIAQKNQRVIKTVALNVASMAFIPL